MRVSDPGQIQLINMGIGYLTRKLNTHYRWTPKFFLYEKEMSPVKVLLLGATGHTGRSILDGLTENGNYVGTSRLEEMWLLD